MWMYDRYDMPIRECYTSVDIDYEFTFPNWNSMKTFHFQRYSNSINFSNYSAVWEFWRQKRDLEMWSNLFLGYDVGVVMETQLQVTWGRVDEAYSGHSDV